MATSSGAIITRISHPQLNSLGNIAHEDNISIRQVKKTKKKAQEEKRPSSAGLHPVSFDFTEVFVWGDDSQGQLGLYHQKIKKGYSSIKSFKIPKTCSFNILIKQISCGENHSAILTNSGHLYMMGSNSHGQLGISEICMEGFQNVPPLCAPAPCLVDSLRDIKLSKVVCGSQFTIALSKG